MDVRYTKGIAMTDMTTTDRSEVGPPQRTLLGRVLLDNGAVTAPLGVLLLVAAARLDSWLGVNAWVLVALGVGLVGYAFNLVGRSSQTSPATTL